MSNAASKERMPTTFERLSAARNVIRQEFEALQRLHQRLPDDFSLAIDLILECRGSVIVTGIGKAGWIGQKISATLASTGTPSHFLHPSEAMHGDLGRIRTGDIVLVLSNSGETGEILQLLPTLHKNQTPVISLTATETNSLAKASTCVLNYGANQEACSLGLAPSTSTTVMLALGDALALTVSQARDFVATDFARFHPGGSLGRKLSSVDDIMRKLDSCRVARDNETVRQIYTRLHGPDRRSGAILLVDEAGKLTGLFTDSDLARLLEKAQDEFFDQSVSKVMTKNPITVTSGTKTKFAVETMACHNISELPVVDSRSHPVGLIDVTDIVSMGL